MNTDGFEYYDYILIHTYNMMVISHEARSIVEGVSKIYILKKDPDTKND